jgi:hypothetical protein
MATPLATPVMTAGFRRAAFIFDPTVDNFSDIERRIESARLETRVFKLGSAGAKTSALRIVSIRFLR